ncbi:glycosyltransferase family 1 protein, partial [Klebsiella pneumoniae]|nr:glycosyltransferase family 1 protein [Klebsiella pneumoniae]
ERYLGEPNFRQYYYDKLAQYERADAIFAISRSSMQEVIDYTSIPAEKIINISSGVSDSFKIKDYTHDEIKDLRNKYHLPQEFILSLAMI